MEIKGGRGAAPLNWGWGEAGAKGGASGRKGWCLFSTCVVALDIPREQP